MIVCLGVAIAVLGVFGAVGVGGVFGAGARSVFKIRFSAVKCFFHCPSEPFRAVFVDPVGIHMEFEKQLL